MSRTPRFRLAALVAAFHLLLLWGLLLQPAWRWPAVPVVQRPPLVVRLLAEAPVTKPAAPPARPTDALRSSATAPARRLAPHPTADTARAITVPVVPDAVSVEAAASSASAPAAARLLDNDATRRAVAQAARQPGWRDRGDQAIAQGHLSASERLGRDVAESARGNCAKGEFAGGGMGLLSLPFLVAAEVRGKCSQ
jgi:hypothetical protein